MTGLRDIWICAEDLQLIRADRIVSLLVPFAPGRGAASPGDRPSGGAVFAEVAGGIRGDSLTSVKLSDCGKSPPGELLGALARALAAAAASEPSAPGACLFVFAERDPAGQMHWISASDLPEAWSPEHHPDPGPTTPRELP